MLKRNAQFFSSLEANRMAVRRDLDPRAPYWCIFGAFGGILLWLTALPEWAWGHSLLHERGLIQPLIMIAGGMVAGFIATKTILLIKEISYQNEVDLPVFPIERINDGTNVLSLLERKPGVLSRRYQNLVRLWIDTDSGAKVERVLDNDTEAFDLAQQASYSLPRIIVWSIPVLGFIGTVMGIGEAVSGFQGFLNKADDIDALRDGLVNVTSGLGTAFDTTFLALAISVIVVFPLTLVERIEQRLLTKVDLTLRRIVLETIPERSAGGGGASRKNIDESIELAFQRHLPSPEILVEPAKEYAERSSQLIVQELMPLKQMADSATAAIEDARLRIRDNANELSESFTNASNQLKSTIESLQPVLEQIRSMAEASTLLTHEIEQLRTGYSLGDVFAQLEKSLIDMKEALGNAQKPRRVVLVEETVDA